MHIEEVDLKQFRITGLPVIEEPTTLPGIGLGCIVDGQERPCRFLQKVLYHAIGAAPEREDIRKFLQVYQHCIDHGKLAYGQLMSSAAMLPLAPEMPVVDPGPHPGPRARTLITIYACSDFDNDALNAWLGVPMFVEEGALAHATEWPNIWRRWNDDGFRKRVWRRMLGGRPSASDEQIEAAARAVLGIESSITSAEYEGSGSAALDLPNLDEALELAEAVVAALA